MRLSKVAALGLTAFSSFAHGWSYGPRPHQEVNLHSHPDDDTDFNFLLHKHQGDLEDPLSAESIGRLTNHLDTANNDLIRFYDFITYNVDVQNTHFRSFPHRYTSESRIVRHSQIIADARHLMTTCQGGLLRTISPKNVEHEEELRGIWEKLSEALDLSVAYEKKAFEMAVNINGHIEIEGDLVHVPKSAPCELVWPGLEEEEEKPVNVQHLEDPPGVMWKFKDDLDYHERPGDVPNSLGNDPRDKGPLEPFRENIYSPEGCIRGHPIPKDFCRQSHLDETHAIPTPKVDSEPEIMDIDEDSTSPTDQQTEEKQIHKSIEQGAKHLETILQLFAQVKKPGESLETSHKSDDAAVNFEEYVSAVFDSLRHESDVLRKSMRDTVGEVQNNVDGIAKDIQELVESLKTVEGSYKAAYEKLSEQLRAVDKLPVDENAVPKESAQHTLQEPTDQPPKGVPHQQHDPAGDQKEEINNREPPFPSCKNHYQTSFSGSVRGTMLSIVCREAENDPRLAESRGVDKIIRKLDEARTQLWQADEEQDEAHWRVVRALEDEMLRRWGVEEGLWNY